MVLSRELRRRIRRLIPSRSYRMVAGMMSQYMRHCNQLSNQGRVQPVTVQVPEAEQDVAPENEPIVIFPESSDSEPEDNEPGVVKLVNGRLTIVGEGGLDASFSPELADLANTLAPIILQAMTDYHHHP